MSREIKHIQTELQSLNSANENVRQHAREHAIIYKHETIVYWNTFNTIINT